MIRITSTFITNLLITVYHITISFSKKLAKIGISFLLFEVHTISVGKFLLLPYYNLFSGRKARRDRHQRILGMGQQTQVQNNQDICLIVHFGALVSNLVRHMFHLLYGVLPGVLWEEYVCLRMYQRYIYAMINAAFCRPLMKFRDLVEQSICWHI